MTSIFSAHSNWDFPHHTTLDDLAKVTHDYCLTKSNPLPLSNMWNRWKLILTHSQPIHTDLNAGDTEVKKKKKLTNTPFLMAFALNWKIKNKQYRNK